MIAVDEEAKLWFYLVGEVEIGSLPAKCQTCCCLGGRLLLLPLV